ncbi:MAG: hypothetical protein B6I36_08855 [Desulfobacteraceae bacterium 4572_35.1]|nr:MAG: hypothetical protein B6I36_08855 [Desulfobacteraceae bacterium 4572_35.1]
MNLKPLSKPYEDSKIWLYLFGIGLFTQISGLLYNNDGSRYGTQSYLLLFLPVAISIIFHKNAINTFRQPAGVLLLGTFSWVIIISIFNSGSDHTPTYSLKLISLLLLYVFAIAIYARNQRAFTWLLISTVIAASLCACLTYYYQYLVLGKPLVYKFMRGGGRLREIGWHGFGDLKNPIIAGLYFGSFAITSTYLFVNSKLKLWQNIIAILAMTSLYTYVLLSFSRGALFSTATAYFVLLLLYLNRKSWILLFITCLLLTITTYLFVPQLESEWVRGFSGRGAIWINWFEHLSEFWLFGSGAGTDLIYRGYKHAHSLYLQLWYEYGVVGISFFTLLLVSLLKKGWRCRTQPLAKLGLALLVFAMVSMISDIYAIIHRPSPFWVVVWFPVGLLLGIEDRKSKEIKTELIY